MAATTGKLAKADARLDICKHSWAQRPDLQKVEAATLCFAELAEGLIGDSQPDAVELRKRALNATLEGHFYILHRSPRTEAERTHIAHGLEVVEQFILDYPQEGAGSYWRASFLTKEAQMKDRGRVIPTNMMSALKKIRADLALAMDKSPTFHRYGPFRIYGKMQIMAPAFPAGGNAREGELYLRRAYDLDWVDAGNPSLNVFPASINAIFLAEGLIKVGKNDEAKVILNRLIQNDVSIYGEEKRPDTLEDQAQAKVLVETL
mgnify:CR=1 FL=1